MALCLRGPGNRLSAVCPVQACLLLLEGTLPGLEVAARASVLTDSILCPAPQCVSGAPRPGPPHLPLLSLSSSLVLRLRQCSLPPLSLSGLLAGPVQPGFGVGMGLADSSAGPLPSPVGHRSPTPASQGLGGGRERPFSLQCILAICLSAFPRLCRPPAWLLLSWPHKSRWEFSGLRVRLTGGEDRLPLTGHVLACIP